jgi:hypothetical protein
MQKLPVPGGIMIETVCLYNVCNTFFDFLSISGSPTPSQNGLNDKSISSCSALVQQVSNDNWVFNGTAPTLVGLHVHAKM